MIEPDKAGYYWIKTKSGERVWEIAYFDVLWQVIGMEYGYTSEELGLITWEGPLTRSKI